MKKKPRRGVGPRHTKATKGRTHSQPKPKKPSSGQGHEKRMTGGGGY